MTATTIDIQSVIEAGNLITLDEAYNILSTTEPMVEQEFALDGSDQVAFNLPLGWNDGIREESADFLTPCEISINGQDPVQLTKESLLKMTSSIGLTKDYVLRSPGPLIQANLNWWVRNHGVKGAEGMRLLSKDGVGVAFVKSSLSTFQNIPVLNRIVDSAKKKFQTDEFFVDYKLAHSLERTALRLIVPSYVRTIDSARHQAGEEDNWSLGIQLTNSLMADQETRLNVSGYLFAWWCTNGAISTHATSGNYNRRVMGQDYDEVLKWVEASVDAIFDDLPLELNEVQAMTEVSLEGELNDVVNDVFKQLKVPAPARKSVVDALVDSDDLTAYGLMQAITQAANDPSISDRVRESTMRVGGLIPHTVADRCASCHRVVL